MRKKRVLPVVYLLLLCFFVGTVSGCGDENATKIVFTTGFGQDEIFRIEEVSCKKPEIMVYLTNIQNRYEDVYGAGIWDVSYEGESFEEDIKMTVLAGISQIKTMCILAEEKGITIDEDEQKAIESVAEEYYKSLKEKEIELLEITPELITNMYKEYYLAGKVYRFIIQDINPEISDDEARTITIQHILLQTGMVDDAGNHVEYDDDMRRELFQKASEIREEALTPGADFAKLAAKYSDDSTVTYSFGKGQMDETFETVAFMLETGEISEVVETSAGYHIIKCISTFDKEQTEASKLEIVGQRRKKVFEEEYDAFSRKLVRRLNNKVWENITMIRDEELTTNSFFELFLSRFPKE